VPIYLALAKALRMDESLAEISREVLQVGALRHPI